MEVDIAKILLTLVVVLVAAKLAAELAERIRVPVVVAEIIAGIVVGPSVLGWVPSPAMAQGDFTAELLAVLGEIGVILLLLEVGLEMRLSELRAVGRASMTVAFIGVGVPMLAGWGAAAVIGEPGNTALFLGAALAATSVGITARVFSDLRALGTIEARTVLGAAVIDDVLGLVILTVVVRIVEEGSIALSTLAVLIGVAIGFLVVASLVGVIAAPRVFDSVQRRARSSGTLIALAVAFTLGIAFLADEAKLAPIVGAFVAGLALAESRASDRIVDDLRPIANVFVPIFFLGIGVNLELEKLFSGEVFAVAGVLLVAAIVGKLVAGWGAIGTTADRTLVGIGMLPRGEVGLIFATIGLKTGVLGENLYGALLLVVLSTTLVAPPLLRWRVNAVRRRRPAVESDREPPPGGWLQLREGVVELLGHPPDDRTVHLAMQAALLMRDARPAASLLDWAGALPDEPLEWGDGATDELLRVLREGDPRAWRFLETSGVLERALPEVADAMHRRRENPYILDPGMVLAWPTVERLQELPKVDRRAAIVAAELRRPEVPVLAALVLDIAGEDVDPEMLAESLIQRLDITNGRAEAVRALVCNRRLMRAAARSVDGLARGRLLQLSTHLGSPEAARALYLFTLASTDLDETGRRRLDEVLARIEALLDRPDLEADEMRELVPERIAAAQAQAADARARERIAAAPTSYLIDQPAESVAQHAALVESLPRSGGLEVSVASRSAGETGAMVEIAARPAAGLVRAAAEVLAEQGFDVDRAAVAVWGDGAIVVSMATTGVVEPDGAALAAAIGEAIKQPGDVGANRDVTLEFDDESSPFATVCEATGPDRRGLFHQLVTAFDKVGAQVSVARLATDKGVASDRFELVMRGGGKVPIATQTAVRQVLYSGGNKPRRRVVPFTKRT
ncbi:MAG: cation:proton antiporter [Acidimicrobiia bacterium]